MTILGIDTSLRSTGYGVLEVKGSRMRMLDCGNVRNSQKVPLTGCLRAIHAKVVELISTYTPDVMAIESVIYGKNAGTMLVLGEARGAVLTAAADAELPVYEYEPRRMKKAVCGNGLAERSRSSGWSRHTLGWASCRRTMPRTRLAWRSAMRIPIPSSPATSRSEP